MDQDIFTTLVRGFDVTVESGETEGTYKVQVSEGGGVPWTVEVPVPLDAFEGENEALDGSNELLNFVSEAAVDLFESSRGTLGQGAGALEVTAMSDKSAFGAKCDSMGCGDDWRSYYLKLKGTAFEDQGVSLIQELLAVQAEESPEDPAKNLRKEISKMECDLALLELELLKITPEQQSLLIIQAHKKPKTAYSGYGMEVPYYIDVFADSPLEQQAMLKIKELLDLQEQLSQAEESDDFYSRKWERQEHIERQLQDLVIQAIQQNMPLPVTGIEAAPNMAGDLAELMEGVDLHPPVANKQAFDESDSAKDRENEGGHIRHDLDPGFVDPEKYDFEPNQSVTLKKKLELMVGGGVPKDYSKGTSAVVVSREDGSGDAYLIRFEDGQVARVRYDELSGSGKKESSTFYGYMQDLLSC